MHRGAGTYPSTVAWKHWELVIILPYLGCLTHGAVPIPEDCVISHYIKNYNIIFFNLDGNINIGVCTPCWDTATQGDHLFSASASIS
jgi:hypothetical protein